MSYTKYYRTFLTKTERAAYDAFVEGAQLTQKEIEMPIFEPESLDRILYAVNFDNPQLFYVDFSEIYYTYNSEIRTMHVSYHHTGAELEALQQKIQKAADNLINGTRGMTLEETALYLHDRLVRRCTYETLSQRPQDAHNLIGPLLDMKCVCEGYAKAYKYLADCIRLPCIVVCGKGVHPDGSSGGHAWNLIKIGKNNFHVDVTFDLLIGKKHCSRAYYRLSTQEILYDHRIESMFPIPDCPVSGSILDKVSGTQELIQFLKTEALFGKTFSEVRLSKGFQSKELLTMIERRLSPGDWSWYRYLDEFWYRDTGKTLFVCWK